MKSQQAIRDSLPDLIFLDINMPAVNGWDFLDHCSKLDENLQSSMKIILLTTSTNPNDQIKAKQWKFVYDYIEKPLTKNVLDVIITKYIDLYPTSPIE